MNQIAHRISQARLRRRAPALSADEGVQISRTAWIVAPAGMPVRLAARVRIDRGADIRPYVPGGFVVIGCDSVVGPYSVLWGHGGLTIGDEVLIGPHVVMVASQHNFREAGSIRAQGTSEKPITIGSDVWIGAHATILGGVTIQSRSVIAAGAVVNSDVRSGAIVGGVPAREIGEMP